MSRFDIAIDRTLSSEGGYVNDPRDPGGETKFGISKRSYPNVDIKGLTRDGAKLIYQRDFWERIHATELPEDLTFQALDFAVNSSIETAVRKLQLAAGVADDGHWGPVTREAVQKANKYALGCRFIAARLDFMRKLAKWPVYSGGWAARIAENLRYLATDFETPDGATA